MQSDNPPKKPNLFIVGAPKCGTTAWVEYLRTHPDIFFPEIKEPHYFATDLPGMLESNSLEDYQALFARSGSARVVGEASVMYLYSTEAAYAIRAFNPDAKILIFLRAQEEALPSLHHQFLYRFTESIEDFEEAWRRSGKRPPEMIPSLCRDPKLLDYASIGRFCEQVERYFALFPAEQIRVVHFGEWTSNPRATYLEILDFLGLDDDRRSDFPRVNEAKSYRNAFVGRLIAHPPRFIRGFQRLLRTITGRKALGLAGRAAKLLAVPGYRTQVGPELRDEIRSFFEEDNRRLEARLAELNKTASASSRGV